MDEKGRRAYIETFDPEYYLDQYFGEPDDEDIFTLEFLAKVLRALPNGLLVLEFGGGPTLYSVAALAWRAAQIHFCDYLDSNLETVNQWLQNEPTAFDWRQHIKAALESQDLASDAQAVSQRVDKMRRIVTRLLRCDACAEQPLPGFNARYDLVSAMHCTDVAATSVSEWQQVLENVSSLVKPGGWLILGVTTGTETNTVNHRTFPCANLSPVDVYNGLLKSNYLQATIQMEKMPVPDNYEREYSGVLMVAAQKSG